MAVIFWGIVLMAVFLLGVAVGRFVEYWHNVDKERGW